MKKTLLCILMIGSALISVAQGNSVKPCTAPEGGQFDFWLGEWDLTWGSDMKGTNSITRDMGTCVIHEHFSDPAKNYLGESWSVYSPQLKVWQQTWIDNSGGYLTFTGEFKDGVMELSRKFTNPNGKLIIQRMKFFNITKDSFDWIYEGSRDEGATWNTNWKIHYQRKK